MILKRASFWFSHEWSKWKSCNQIDSSGSWFRKRWIIWQMPLRNSLIRKCRKKGYNIKSNYCSFSVMINSNQISILVDFSFVHCPNLSFEISFENSIGRNSLKTFRSRGWNIHKAIGFVIHWASVATTYQSILNGSKK